MIFEDPCWGSLEFSTRTDWNGGSAQFKEQNLQNNSDLRNFCSILHEISARPECFLAHVGFEQQRHLSTDRVATAAGRLST